MTTDTDSGTQSRRSGGVDLNTQGDLHLAGDMIGGNKNESAGGHIVHAATGATVIVNERPQDDFIEDKSQQEAELDSLHRQLAAARENLHMIEEREAEFVVLTDIPLQLIKEERRLRSRIVKLEKSIADLTAQIALLTPHQLESPPAIFFGRKDDLASLTAAYSAGKRLFGLFGMAGAGKTALALKFAEQIKADYPEAQILLNLSGASRHPLRAVEVMEYVLHCMFPGLRVPENQHALATAYRSLLSTKRILLLLDNARDAAQVKPLISPGDHCLIITSRSGFDLGGLFSQDVDVLSPPDACSLLQEIAPRINDKQAHRIARLCGYLPLALGPVASQLKMRRALMVEDCIQSLNDKRLLLKTLHSYADLSCELSVDTALEASYDSLNADLQAKWRMLAVFPNEFNTAEASAIWDCSPNDAHSRLGDLTLYSLIEFNEQSGLWRAHDLVRIFIEQKLAPDDRKNIVGNIVKSLKQASMLQHEWALLFGQRLCDPDWRLKEIRPTVLKILWNLVDGAVGPEERLAAALQLLNLHWWSDGVNAISNERMLAFLELVATAADTSVQRYWLIECISLKMTARLHARQRAQLFIHRAALQAQLYEFLDEAGRASSNGRQLNAETKQDYAKAERLIRRLIESEEAHPEDHRFLARICMGKANLALLGAETMSDAKSVSMLQRAIDLYLAAQQAARAYGQDLTLVVEILEELCNAYALLQKWPEAQKQFSKASNLLATKLNKTLDARAYAELYFLVQNSGAEMYSAHAKVRTTPLKSKSDYETACQLTRAAIDQVKKNVGESEDLAIAYFSLGEYLQAIYDLPLPRNPKILGEARKYWRQARDIAHRRGLWSIEHMADKLLKPPA
jgi:hypothetical protein